MGSLTQHWVQRR